MRPIAVTGLKRDPQPKDGPTRDESGCKGFDAMQWYGVVGPAGLPTAIVKQLNESLAQVLGAPDLRDKLAIKAVEPTSCHPSNLASSSWLASRAGRRWRAGNIQLES